MALSVEDGGEEALVLAVDLVGAEVELLEEDFVGQYGEFHHGGGYKKLRKEVLLCQD